MFSSTDFRVFVVMRIKRIAIFELNFQATMNFWKRTKNAQKNINKLSLDLGKEKIDEKKSASGNEIAIKFYIFCINLQTILRQRL